MSSRFALDCIALLLHRALPGVRKRINNGVKKEDRDDCGGDPGRPIGPTRRTNSAWRHGFAGNKRRAFFVDGSKWKARPLSLFRFQRLERAQISDDCMRSSGAILAYQSHAIVRPNGVPSGRTQVLMVRLMALSLHLPMPSSGSGVMLRLTVSAPGLPKSGN